MKSSTGRRTFLATCAMAGAAAARPLAAFGQAVNNAPQASSPDVVKMLADFAVQVGIKAGNRVARNLSIVE